MCSFPSLEYVMQTFTWARFGGYEVSSHGDKRFSAFNALMPDGRSIEQHYQCDVKGYQPGGTNWRLGKGKPPLNRSTDLWTAYLALWRTWATNHRLEMFNLREIVTIANNDVLSDRFATTPVNQAHALSTLLNEGFGA
jgi:hypothetical protein